MKIHCPSTRGARSGLAGLCRAAVAAAALALATSSCKPNTASAPAPQAPRLAPGFDGALVWFNGTEVKLHQLRGRPVLVHFFDYSRVACLDQLQQIEQWRQRYAAHGLVVVGVLAPVHDFALNPLNVQAALKRLAITHPVALDSGYAISQRYGSPAPPGLVLVDKTGLIQWEGPRAGDEAAAEAQLQQLLRQTNPALVLPAAGPDVKPRNITELRLGRADTNLGNAPAGTTNNLPYYRPPTELAVNKIYVAGAWSQLDSLLRHAWDAEDELTDYLELRGTGRELYAVMKPEQVYWKQVLVQRNGQWVDRPLAGADLLHDEQGRSYLKVDRPGLYQVIANQPPGTHRIRLATRGKGLSVYSLSLVE